MELMIWESMLRLVLSSPQTTADNATVCGKVTESAHGVASSTANASRLRSIKNQGRTGATPEIFFKEIVGEFTSLED